MRFVKCQWFSVPYRLFADNGGIHEAYLAYKASVGGDPTSEPTLPGLSKYNSEQLFFMSYASLWCETKTVKALIAQLGSDVHAPHVAR